MLGVNIEYRNSTMGRQLICYIKVGKFTMSTYGAYRLNYLENIFTGQPYIEMYI